ncbi:MAG: two component LuxR family transcriptional regulator [Alphaproteobacteria bacterium]|nr:MAG: two component LuxR family transcriptional regulator [Caulobacteraceae bacterium]TPW03733.1 MAG: two component LuxR family transcriptional regulator [Alphaproteobacteria bacterium]
MTGPTGPTVMIADDHPLFREALKLALMRADSSARAIEAASLADALNIAASEPDLKLVLLDLCMSDSQGFAGLAQLHAERPDTPILVVTGVEQPDAPQRARQFGAVGFIRKAQDLGAISAAISRALAGESAVEPEAPDDPELQAAAARIASLTPMQLKVLLGVLSGKLNKQIAFELSIAEATVKAHMTAILRKLNVLNRTQAALAMRALELDMPALI